jgi:plastocyanin
MLFEVHALSGADFDAWLSAKVASAAATSPPPTPAASAGASGAPPPSGGAPTEIAITAQGLKFSPTEVSAPAGSPITIQFANKDVATAHNIKIFKDTIGGTVVYDGKIFAGDATMAYEVGALAAGTYPFECFVHPTMTGTLTVQ